MIAIIRISGMVDIQRGMAETLFRLRLRRKYSCVVLREKEELQRLLKKIRNFAAYGSISKEVFLELIDKRGELIDKKKKTDKKTVGELYFEGKLKSLKDNNIKPFFRLHPPRGGIKSKLHYPKGVLGDNKEKINELIRRML